MPRTKPTAASKPVKSKKFDLAEYKNITGYDRTSLEASLCKDDFFEFFYRFWDTIPGAGVGKLVLNWHIRMLCEEAQKIAERVFANKPAEYDLVVNISPGTSKSSIFSILFHPWTWTRMPSARHLNASYAGDLVLDLAVKAREVIRSEKYQRMFPEVRLMDSQDAKGLYRNTAGGDRLACTVAGKSPTGFHGHFLITDDPLDPKRAASEAEIQTAKDFITNILPSRKVDKAVSAELLIMQRLHREDPAAVKMAVSKLEGALPVRLFCLPAEEADNIHPPELRANYVDGLMDPVRLSRTDLKRYRITQGIYGYSSQFMQQPVALGGSMFRVEYFNQRVKAAPYNCKRIRYIDRASTADGGCYSAMVLLAKDQDGNFYVEHVVHGQWEPYERNQKMRATALRDRAKYGPKYEPQIYVEREGGSSGRDAWKSVVRHLAGFRVREHQPHGAKDVRAEGWSSQLAAMNVYIVDDGTWDVANYVTEHELFRPDPGSRRLGKWKDQVDASSGAYSLLTGSEASQGLRIFSLNTSGKKTLLKFVVCTRQELENTIIEQRTLLVSFQEPLPLNTSEDAQQESPLHGLQNLIDTPLIMNFGAIDPVNYQEDWDKLVTPYDRLPEDLIMKRDEGKTFWSYLLRKRDKQPEVIVLQDEGDGRAMSVALGLADMFRYMRGDCIWRMGAEDSWKAKEDDKAPIAHVYEMIKSTRILVV